MFPKKKLLIFASFICTFFFVIICYSMTEINNYNLIKEVKIRNVTNGDLENEIKFSVDKLGHHYKVRNAQKDDLIVNFLKHLKNNDDTAYGKLLKEASKWVSNEKLFNVNSTSIGNVIQALKKAKIIKADLDGRGTQLKLLLKLEGNQLAVFKPQWYEREKIILGYVYAGKDRYGSEILSFYLSAILNLPLAPIAVERVIDIQKEILPVATEALNNTVFVRNNRTCIYGKCFYCKREDPACEYEAGSMRGAAIIHIPGKLKSHRSPWQRTYKKNKKNLWETDINFCNKVKAQLSKDRILDLIDVAIFDFLIQNGDRHHYETLNDKVVFLDNGKGLGNPYVHHIDILAPLYQCCRIRSSTWERLKILSGGFLREILMSIPEITNVVSPKNIQSIDERLLLVYSAVNMCKLNNKL